MDLLYTGGLAVALLAGALTLLRGGFALLKGGAQAFPAAGPWGRFLSIRAAVVALALGTAGLVTSVLVHLYWAHGPETAHPLDFRGLIAEHEAFTVAAVLLALGFALTARRSRRSR